MCDCWNTVDNAINIKPTKILYYLGRKTAFLATALFCKLYWLFSGKITNESVQGPLEASDPALSKTIMWENSVVNWYHAYQIKPPITDPPTKFRVDKEYTYIIDRDACLVWLPELKEFNDKLHDMITDHQRH